MPKKYSLKKQKEFENLFKKGRRLYSKHFSIVFQPSETLKFAYISPKKFIKKANRRNYNKRIIREILRKNSLFQTEKKYFIAITCKFDLKSLQKEINFSNLENELTNLVRNVIRQ